VGVGAATLISIKLGQKDYSSANKVLGNVLVLDLIIGIAFTLAFIPVLDDVLYFFGASPKTIKYARDYMQIILIGNVITHTYLGLNAVLRASGFPRMAMYVTLLSVAVNFALNPLFIFVFGWGIRGAAWATVFSQALSLSLQLVRLSSKGREIKFSRGIYRLQKHLVVRIFSIGSSSFMMNACACLIVILITRGLREYGGDLAIGAYGIVNRVAFIFLMIVMGLNQGMQPIAGYNFGAGKYSRVIEVTKLTIMFAVTVSVLGFLVSELFPTAIIKIFTSHNDLIRESVTGIRIIFAVFPLVGFQMVASNFFMSIGLSRTAIFLSLTRQALFLIPCLLILPAFMGTLGVWVSLPVADFVSSAVSATVLISYFRKCNKTVAELAGEAPLPESRWNVAVMRVKRFLSEGHRRRLEIKN
jgi:putative MATE family efflux protein